MCLSTSRLSRELASAASYSADVFPLFATSSYSTTCLSLLGLHAGSCIAVTTDEVLDYFGSVVKLASRLEHQCRGGEVIISDEAPPLIKTRD